MKLVLTFGLSLFFSMQAFSASQTCADFFLPSQNKTTSQLSVPQKILQQATIDGFLLPLQLEGDTIARLKTLYSENESFNNAMNELIRRDMSIKRSHRLDEILPDGPQGENTRWAELAVKVLKNQASVTEAAELQNIENNQRNERSSREWALKAILTRQLQLLSYMDPQSNIRDFESYGTNGKSLIFTHFYYMAANIDRPLLEGARIPTRIYILDKLATILDKWIAEVSNSHEPVNLEDYVASNKYTEELKEFVENELNDSAWFYEIWPP